MSQYSDRELVARAMANAWVNGFKKYWAVERTFGVGTTVAREMCVEFNYNPDAESVKDQRTSEAKA